jgi:nucleoside-diphosphate-sugar epimerase
MTDWVILGCGYIGTRLARALLADGERVVVAGRQRQKLAALEAAGATFRAIDAARPRSFAEAIAGAQHPVVVYSIPPVPGQTGGENLRHAAAAAQRAGATRFLLLGSTAVYGETPDGEVVDEDTATVSSDPDARPRVIEEIVLESAASAGLPTVVLRLSAVYGPGRGVRERLIAGSYLLLDDGVHVYSRVHVDDVVGIARAAAARAQPGAIYCVGDDRPTTQREYADWLADRIGAARASSAPSFVVGTPRRPIRNRAVSNARVKRELGYVFRYPTYLEGEAAVDDELGRARA